MSSKIEFKREDRYAVIKYSQLTDAQIGFLKNCIFGEGIPTVECVVVESDWPEYETVWGMIENRCAGHLDPVEWGEEGISPAPILSAAPVVERQPVVIGNLYRTAEDQLEIELVGNPKITDGMSLYTAPPDLAKLQAQVSELDRDNTRLTKELDDALDRSDKLQETISQLKIEIKYLEARLAWESKK
jgi:FtsZ-binding cell division protein ZapB